MSDQQRIKLLNLMCKLSAPSVQILNRYNERKNSLEPFCFQVEEMGTNEKVYVSIVFGEFLYYVTSKFIWDSAMDRGAPMPAKLREEAENLILKKARNISKDGELRIHIMTRPIKRAMEENLILLIELIKEIENATT